ncbi:MAG: ABC transporter permease [Jatrophihabitantaceae bacterium]
MFIALRDLRFAKGRFALLAGVIALMTFMVVMLGGLTAGLGAASISAVDALPVGSIAFQQPAGGQDLSFSNSTLPSDTVRKLATQPGVHDVHPLGISTTQLRGPSSTVAVTLLGSDPSMFPPRHSGQAVKAGEVAVTAKLASDEQLKLGDTVGVDGQSLRVGAIVKDTSFNHLPVVYTPIATWQQLTRSDTITAVGLTLSGSSPAVVGAAADVRVVSKDGAFAAVGAYSSEQGSLNLMRALLVAVSVLIVGSFFTVWTMQRAGDLAVVRAIGGSRSYLLTDALGQAAIVLLSGAAAGATFAALAGLLAARVVPFLLTVSTVALPLLAMVAVGLVGAALSVRKVTKIDPLSALGAVR